MNIYNEIMKMNSFLKKYNKTLIINKKNGLIQGISNDLMPCFDKQNKKFRRMLK
jgi:predicted DNA-binding protein YlxM (UPF0122 family)